MNFKAMLESAWQDTLTFLGPLVLLTLVYALAAICSLGILTPVLTAGYIQSLLLARRQHRPPVVRDLFSEMSLFAPLFLLFVLMLVLMAIGFVLFVLPGFLVAVAITFATFYLLPLMTDRRLGLVAALRGSWRLATLEPVTDHLVVVVLYLIIVALAGSVPLLFLVGQPLAVFLLLAAYEARCRTVAGGPPPPPPPGN